MEPPQKSLARKKKTDSIDNEVRRVSQFKDVAQMDVSQSLEIISYKSQMDETTSAKFREFGKVLTEPDNFIVRQFFPNSEWIKPRPWRIQPTRPNFCLLMQDIVHTNQNYTSLITKCPYDIVAIYDPEIDFQDLKPPSNPNATNYYIMPSRLVPNESKPFFLGYYKECVDLPPSQEERLIVCTHLIGPSNISNNLQEEPDMTEIKIDDENVHRTISTDKVTNQGWKICSLQ